jgi:hypothetical protein
MKSARSRTPTCREFKPYSGALLSIAGPSKSIAESGRQKRTARRDQHPGEPFGSMPAVGLDLVKLRACRAYAGRV